MDAPRPSRDLTLHPDRDLRFGVVALVLGLAPALGAIAWYPEFTTQDGPAHLYSARIIGESLRPDSPFEPTFAVDWRPLPNWFGHLLTMAAVSTLPPTYAGRAITGLTLVALAGSVVWLRWRVAGPGGLWLASVLAVLLGLNVTWLLGFTSFLLGAALVPVTLGVWWGGRGRFGPGRATWLAALLVAGYFCHPIGLGLAVLGLGILAAATPGPARVVRGVWTAASLSPLVPLALVYRALTRSGGGLEPTWEHLSQPWSVGAWIGQAGWADPISLAAKTFRPFSPASSAWNAGWSPALWAALGVAILAAATALGGRARGRRGWAILAGVLLAGALLGPDTLGVKHGHYLPQRVALLGLMVLVPWLDLGPGRWPRRIAAGASVLALGLQSAFVWDYGATCRDRVGPILGLAPAIRDGDRVGTLLNGIRGRFRSNPLLHADCLLGLESDAILWTNYETTHYYFPVKVRAGIPHPPASDFERLAVLDDPDDAAKRLRAWSRLLDDHARSIDLVIEWGEDPDLDSRIGAGYGLVRSIGPARAWSRSARGP